jgi:excisionase family DNA binding protein
MCMAGLMAPLLPLLWLRNSPLANTAAAATASTVPSLGRSVSIDQAARLLDVSRRTIYNRIREGRLRTVRTLGGSQRVLVESLSDNGFTGQPIPAADAVMAAETPTTARN